MCVCVCERERERERVCVSVCMGEGGGGCSCALECAWLRVCIYVSVFSCVSECVEGGSDARAHVYVCAFE